MEVYENILLSENEGILTITINRPSKLNALNQQTLEELRSAIQSVYDNRDVRGVIITGAGEKAFVAGADIKELSQVNEMNARKFAENGQEIFDMIENCHTPVVAVVNGFALGGGCELAMACHMRVASSNARFGQPEVNLGVIPGYGGTQRLTQLVGKGKALELMMTADIIGADEAHTLGLVNHVANTKEDAIVKAGEILSKITQKAPIAVGLVVDCVNTVFTKEKDGYLVEANSFASCCTSADFKEGTEAFLAKRPANFTGE
ncbi:MAG: enoyl-CoA hydratase-related protein [Bacteroidota bacterium]